MSTPAHPVPIGATVLLHDYRQPLRNPKLLHQKANVREGRLSLDRVPYTRSRGAQEKSGKNLKQH
jgi:hypothetical protein